MEKTRIFIVNQTDHSQRYGVGKYIKEIIEEGKLRPNYFEVISVLIGYPKISLIEKKQKDNITFLKIPRPFFWKGNIQSLSYLYSKATFILLNELYDFKNTDIFHFNSNMQHFLMQNIKTYTKSKLLYTIHVSLWKTYYENNFEKFISDYKNPDCDIFYKKSICVEAENCKLADQVICLSDSMKQDVLDIYNISKHKVVKIPNGVVEQRFNSDDLNKIAQLRKTMNIKENDFVFLYIGRLVPQKGIPHLMDAFKSILKEHSKNLKLLLVGDGSMLDHLKKECEDFKDNIVFTGYIPADNVKLYYKLADTLIFPSLNEQSSYVMLEAMSLKVPMLVTDIPVFKTLKHNYSCLKIGFNEKKELDQESFKRMLKKVMDDNGLRCCLAENAYRLYTQEYSSKAMFNNTYLS